MTAIEEAAQIYDKYGLHLGTDIQYHIKYGCVICMPDVFLMGREILLSRGENVFCERGDGDAWFVQFALGRGALKWFLGQAPRRLPFLAWTRIKHKKDGIHPIHIVRTERFEKLI